MLNQDLAERMDDGMFLTLFVALFDSDGSVQIVNAGQTPPLIWRKASGEIQTIPGNGPALGMMEDFEYQLAPLLQLEPGDALLTLTDGLVEARHESDPDNLFDEAGVRGVLTRMADEDWGAEELTEALVAAALKFAGGAREDDMTVVTVLRTAEG